MRRVLLIGGSRDGDRVQVQDDYRDYIMVPGRFTVPAYYRYTHETPAEMHRIGIETYQLERFTAGTTTMWIGYPEGTRPEHGLAMLLAGYVGSNVQ